MYAARVSGLIIARQTFRQAPTVGVRTSMLINQSTQIRTLADQGWAQKISSFFNFGKDEKEKDPQNTMTGSTDDTLSLQSYFKHLDKLGSLKKMGLGGAIEKLVGVGLDSSHENIIENHKKLQQHLSEAELAGSTLQFSSERRNELLKSTGLSSQDIEQIVSMYSHIQQVKKVFDKAKSEGKVPQSIDEIKEMIGGVVNKATNQFNSNQNQGSTSNTASGTQSSKYGYDSTKYETNQQSQSPRSDTYSPDENQHKTGRTEGNVNTTGKYPDSTQSGSSNQQYDSNSPYGGANKSGNQNQYGGSGNVSGNTTGQSQGQYGNTSKTQHGTTDIPTNQTQHYPNTTNPKSPFPTPEPQAVNKRSLSESSTSVHSTPSGSYSQQIPIHRFTPMPRKEKETIGKNDVVTITDGNETQEMKFKKAEPLIATGRWRIVE